MKSYLEMSRRYLGAHKKRTRLSVMSVVLSVALVVGIFSMVDILLRVEKQEIIRSNGNYHIAVIDPDEKTRAVLASRIDVENSGVLYNIGEGSLSGKECTVISIDEGFSEDMSIILEKGAFPRVENELMLEVWAAEELGLEVGQSVKMTRSDKTENTYTISGLYKDFSSTKAQARPGIVISTSAARQKGVAASTLFLLRFKQGVNIRKAIKDIEKVCDIKPDQISKNEHLLAVLGQSDKNTYIGLYWVSAILFTIVLIAGVVMIYNSFNISVGERMRAFGLLRCVGASKAQIRRIVKKEGWLLLRFAIPIGILLGIAVTVFCSALLRSLNDKVASSFPLFTISLFGLAAGAVVGVLTVFLATLLPARKASRVSPVAAVTGSARIKVRKAKKAGFLTRLFPAETAMGASSALSRKKTLALMTASIALGIIMFLGFNIFIKFLYASIRTTKPYTPDITLSSEEGFSQDTRAKISALPGVKNATGFLSEFLYVSVEASRVTKEYRNAAGDITTDTDGYTVFKNMSTLTAYDSTQLDWAKADLIEGRISEKELNEKNGVIAVKLSLYNGQSMTTADLHVGDKVKIRTAKSEEELPVLAVLRLTFNEVKGTGFVELVTTTDIYKKFVPQDSYSHINIQLRRGHQEETVNQIKSIISEKTMVMDKRQQNKETNQAFYTLAVFVYGFVAVIALISILNMISTMYTSINSKIKYFGVMRAVGMSGRQLTRMVIAEAMVYCLTGAAAGCALGVWFQKWLIENFLTATKVVWSFPYGEIAGIAAAALLVTLFSCAGPLKKIRSQGITENIGSLQ